MGIVRLGLGDIRLHFDFLNPSSPNKPGGKVSHVQAVHPDFPFGRGRVNELIIAYVNSHMSRTLRLTAFEKPL
jgi:hypothetical protein